MAQRSVLWDKSLHASRPFSDCGNNREEPQRRALAAGSSRALLWTIGKVESLDCRRIPVIPVSWWTRSCQRWVNRRNPLSGLPNSVRLQNSWQKMNAFIKSSVYARQAHRAGAMPVDLIYDVLFRAITHWNGSMEMCLELRDDRYMTPVQSIVVCDRRPEYSLSIPGRGGLPRSRLRQVRRHQRLGAGLRSFRCGRCRLGTSVFGAGT